MIELIKEIKSCTICAPHLDHEPNPIFSIHPDCSIVIIGQAPGSIVHSTGVPWNDKSGENLRNWMGVSEEEFYNPQRIAIIPMGFCYPGKGNSGDLPPRKECAPKWHNLLLNNIKKVKIILLIGMYAQSYYLQDRACKTLTQTVNNFEDYLPEYFVLPHPSPRNNIWQAKNPWFNEKVVPRLRDTIRMALH